MGVTTYMKSAAIQSPPPGLPMPSAGLTDLPPQGGGKYIQSSQRIPSSQRITLNWLNTSKAIPAIYLLLFILTPAIAETRPQRIVSMNLCTDQLLMMLADREQIISLSYAAADPNQSLVADKVGDIPLNYGHAEEVVPLKARSGAVRQFHHTVYGSFVARAKHSRGRD